MQIICFANLIGSGELKLAGALSFPEPAYAREFR